MKVAICPECGCRGVYTGFNQVECLNSSCRHYRDTEPKWTLDNPTKRGYYWGTDTKHEYQNMRLFYIHEESNWNAGKTQFITRLKADLTKEYDTMFGVSFYLGEGNEEYLWNGPLELPADPMDRVLHPCSGLCSCFVPTLTEGE
jgi:hypothetical protein